MAICTQDLKEEGVLRNNTIVTTVMSNMGLSIALEKMGVKQIRSKVGDRYVLEEMLKNDAVIGGEDSGHLLFLDYHTSGDGIISALQVLSIMMKKNKPLSELAEVMDVFPQVLINIDTKSKPPIEEQPEIMDAINEVERALGNKGRVLVRYSGTQSMCRVMIEGPTQKETQKYAELIADVVRDRLG